MRVGTRHIAFATIGALVLGGASLAQQIPEVVVEAPHVEKTTQAGPMGQRLPAVSVVYRVTYSDLNIATHSGAVELEKRIKDTAKQACEQLRKLYPESSEGATPCVDGAIKSAMAQVNKAVAAAEKAAKNKG
jgi:UrcA family protein